MRARGLGASKGFRVVPAIPLNGVTLHGFVETGEKRKSGGGQDLHPTQQTLHLMHQTCTLLG